MNMSKLKIIPIVAIAFVSAAVGIAQAAQKKGSSAGNKEPVKYQRYNFGTVFTTRTNNNNPSRAPVTGPATNRK
jgi:hypothetical protein